MSQQHIVMMSTNGVKKEKSPVLSQMNGIQKLHRKWNIGIQTAKDTM
jgi:hypothetical protein